MPGARYIAAVPWTPAEHAELRKLWLAGMGPSEIARELGSHRSKTSVINKARNLHLPKMRPGIGEPRHPSPAPPHARPQPLRPGARTLPPLPSEMNAGE